MQKTIQLLSQSFISSSGPTPQFNTYARTFKREITQVIKSIGGELVSFNKGHFYVSGFFKVGNQMYYFSQSDVRWFSNDPILVRTAQHDKDFTGGCNHMVPLSDTMFNRLPV